MWSRDALVQRVEKRKKAQEQVPEAEEALLAYARWQGLTNEENVDRDAAKATLDRICASAEPEAWRNLSALIGDVDDGLLKNFMHYTLTQALEEVRQQIRDLDEPEPSPEPPAPSRRRSRGRSR